MPLVLSKMTSVHLDNVSTRQEHHGEALVPAIDLKCTWVTNNRALDMLHPELRAALMANFGTQEQPGDGQQKMDLPVDELPNVRYSKLKYPLKFSIEEIGRTVVFDYGLGGKSNITLSLCKICDFWITPIEGGTVEWQFRISSAADIDEHTIGILSLQQQRDIDIKILLPKPGSEGDRLLQQSLAAEEPPLGDGEGGDDGDGPAGGEGGEGKEPSASDLFAAEHGTAKQKARAKKTPAKKTPAKKPAAKKTAAKKA